MTTYYSTEYTTHRDGPDKNAPHTSNGVVYEYAQFTGTALSSSHDVEMMKIPAGVRILPTSLLSFRTWKVPQRLMLDTRLIRHSPMGLPWQLMRMLLSVQ